MTTLAVSAVISMFCQFHNIDIKTNVKFDCMDYMINCIVNKPAESIETRHVLVCENNYNAGMRFKER